MFCHMVAGSNRIQNLVPSVPIRGHEGRLECDGSVEAASWTTELAPDTPGLALISDITMASPMIRQIMLQS